MADSKDTPNPPCVTATGILDELREFWTLPFIVNWLNVLCIYIIVVLRRLSVDVNYVRFPPTLCDGVFPDF